AGVALTGEQILFAFPDRLVNVHTGTVIADEWLRHERRCFSVLGSGVVNGILQALNPIGALNEWSEFGADFILSCGCHFVVVHFNNNTNLLECHRNRGTDVLERVDGWNREVATLHCGTMAFVAIRELIACGPCTFLGMNLVMSAGHPCGPFNCIENEKLGLRTEECGITQASGFQVLGAALCDGAW